MISERVKLIVDLALGDGCLYKRESDKYPIIRLAHSLKQKLYCESKEKLLNDYGFITHHYLNKNNSKGILRYYYSVYTNQDSDINTAYKYLYNEKKKKIDKHLISILDKRSLAYLFMDDGSAMTSNKSRSKRLIYLYDQKFATGFKLSTNCFGEEENILIKNWLHDKFGIESSLCGLVNRTYGIYLMISQRDSMRILVNLISPYFTEDLKYKISFPIGSKGLTYTTIDCNFAVEETKRDNASLINEDDAIVQQQKVVEFN